MQFTGIGREDLRLLIENTVLRKNGAKIVIDHDMQ